MICLSSARHPPEIRPCRGSDRFLTKFDGHHQLILSASPILALSPGCDGLSSITQSAFEGLMIRLILQFIRIIACCRVLHRSGSRDIHRHELSRPDGSQRRPHLGFTLAYYKFENFRNDPAAGSPTATLLRLLLPLLVKHGSTFAGRERTLNLHLLTCIPLTSVATTGGVYKWHRSPVIPCFVIQPRGCLEHAVLFTVITTDGQRHALRAKRPPLR